jgi:hypothetical protein
LVGIYLFTLFIYINIHNINMRPRTVDRLFDTLEYRYNISTFDGMATVKQRTSLGITCHYRTTILKLETLTGWGKAKKERKKKKNTEALSEFSLARMPAQRDDGGERIQLGDNTGGDRSSSSMTSLDFNWSPL